jgi:hypothetical protein
MQSQGRMQPGGVDFFIVVCANCTFHVSYFLSVEISTIICPETVAGGNQLQAADEQLAKHLLLSSIVYSI